MCGVLVSLKRRTVSAGLSMRHRVAFGRRKVKMSVVSVSANQNRCWLVLQTERLIAAGLCGDNDGPLWFLRVFSAQEV